MTPEDWFTEKKIGDFLKGALAEKICELMHRELKCQIYRTGHEHLYPHLIDTAFALRKLRYRIDPSKLMKDLEDMQSFADPPPANVHELLRMKQLGQSVITSNPDFTIVYPTGVIGQIEAKYRHDGKFNPEELKKYKDLTIPPDIFVVMKKPPYLRILTLVKRYLLTENPENIEFEYFDLDENKGSLHKIEALISDTFTYPKNILEKYRDIISQINWDSLYFKEIQGQLK